jgi:hypothetical protein
MHTTLKPSGCKDVFHGSNFPEIAHSFCVWFPNNFAYLRRNGLKYFPVGKFVDVGLGSAEIFLLISPSKLWHRNCRGRDMGDSGNQNLRFHIQALAAQ